MLGPWGHLIHGISPLETLKSVLWFQGTQLPPRPFSACDCLQPSNSRWRLFFTQKPWILWIPMTGQKQSIESMCILVLYYKLGIYIYMYVYYIILLYFILFYIIYIHILYYIYTYIILYYIYIYVYYIILYYVILYYIIYNIIYIYIYIWNPDTSLVQNWSYLGLWLTMITNHLHPQIKWPGIHGSSRITKKKLERGDLMVI